MAAVFLLRIMRLFHGPNTFTVNNATWKKLEACKSNNKGKKMKDTKHNIQRTNVRKKRVNKQKDYIRRAWGEKNKRRKKIPWVCFELTGNLLITQNTLIYVRHSWWTTWNLCTLCRACSHSVLRLCQLPKKKIHSHYKQMHRP